MIEKNLKIIFAPNAHPFRQLHRRLRLQRKRGRARNAAQGEMDPQDKLKITVSPPPGIILLLRLIPAQKQKPKRANQRDPKHLVFFAVVQRMQQHNKQRGDHQRDAGGNL